MATLPAIPYSFMDNFTIIGEKKDFLKCNICNEVSFHVNNSVGMADHVRGKKHLKKAGKDQRQLPPNPATGLLSPTASSLSTEQKRPNTLTKAAKPTNSKEAPTMDTKSSSSSGPAAPAAVSSISRCELCGAHINPASSKSHEPSSSPSSSKSLLSVCGNTIEDIYCESCAGAITQSVFTEFQQTLIQEALLGKQVKAQTSGKVPFPGVGWTCEGCGARCLYDKTSNKHRQKCLQYKALEKGGNITVTETSTTGTTSSSSTSSEPSTSFKKKKKKKGKTIKCAEKDCQRMFKTPHHMQTHFDVTHLRDVETAIATALPRAALPSPPTELTVFPTTTTTAAAITTNQPDKTVICTRPACQKKFGSETSMRAHYTSGSCNPDKPKKWKSLLKRLEPIPVTPTTPPSPRTNKLKAVGKVECKGSNCNKKFINESAMQMHFDSGSCKPKPQTATTNTPQVKKKKNTKKKKARPVECENATCGQKFKKQEHMKAHFNTGCCRRDKSVPPIQAISKPTTLVKKAEKRAQKPTLLCTGAPACTKTFKCQESVRQHVESGKCKGIINTGPPIMIDLGVEVPKVMAEPSNEVAEKQAQIVCQSPPESPTEQEQDLDIIPVEAEKELMVLIPTPPPEEPVAKKSIRSRSPVRNLSRRREKWVIVGRDEVELNNDGEEDAITPVSDSDDDDFVHVERILD